MLYISAVFIVVFLPIAVSGFYIIQRRFGRTFALAWLVGAIHNVRRAPAARERATTPLAWVLGIAAYLVLRWVLPATLWNPVTVDTRWLVALGVRPRRY